jgi:hypothetical protein
MGRRFGRLTVVGRARSQHQMTAWRCRCQCGRFAEYRSDILRAGKLVSCGCAERETRFGPGNDRGKATRFQPGSNLIFTDDLIRDELLSEFRSRRATTDGRWFYFANGARVLQGGLRERIAKRLGAEPAAASIDRALKVRIGRVFKSIVAGLPATGSAAIAAGES